MIARGVSKIEKMFFFKKVMTLLTLLFVREIASTYLET